MAAPEFVRLYRQLTDALSANHNAHLMFRQAVEDGERQHDISRQHAEQDCRAAVGWADQALRIATQAHEEGRIQLLAAEVGSLSGEANAKTPPEGINARVGLEQAQQQARSTLAALQQAHQRLLDIRAEGLRQRQWHRRIALMAGGAVVILILVGGLIYTIASRPPQRTTSTGAVSSGETAAQPTSVGVGQSTSMPTAVLPATVQVNVPTAIQAESASIVQPQPTSTSIDFNFQVVSVRVGIADGKRLRVVVDLMPLKPDTDLEGLFEPPTFDPSSGIVKLVVHAQVDKDPPVKYLAEKAQASAALSLETMTNGLEVRIVPKTQLHLRDVFVLPHTPPDQPNDRLVVDLCFTEDCPILRR